MHYTEERERSFPTYTVRHSAAVLRSTSKHPLIIKQRVHVP